MQKAPIFRNSHAEVRYFRDTYDHALALYVDHHHQKILFLLLSCWTSFSWLVLIRRCCCCSCYGRFRCVVRRCCWRSCCLRGSYLLQCWHHPAQFKLPLPSLALSMWYVCDLLEIFDKLNTWSTFTFKFWSAYTLIQSNLASSAAPLSRWKGQHERLSLFLVCRQWSTGLKALVDIPAPGKRAKMISSSSSSSSTIPGIRLSNNHLRSGGRAIPTAGHPDLATYNRGTSSPQWSWQGSEGSPGLCPREEGEHRREVVGSIVTPSNDECLEMSIH